MKMTTRIALICKLKPTGEISHLAMLADNGHEFYAIFAGDYSFSMDFQINPHRTTIVGNDRLIRSSINNWLESFADYAIITAPNYGKALSDFCGAPITSMMYLNSVGRMVLPEPFDQWREYLQVILDNPPTITILIFCAQDIEEEDDRRARAVTYLAGKRLKRMFPHLKKQDFTLYGDISTYESGEWVGMLEDIKRFSADCPDIRLRVIREESILIENGAILKPKLRS